MAAHLTTGYPVKTGTAELQLKSLQETVSALIDELSHLLYNLDAGNVREAMTVQKLKAGSVTAEAISQSYKAEVESSIDGSAAELRQEFTAAEGRLTSEIELVKETGENLSSRLSQTEDSISGMVSKKMSFESATRKAAVPTRSNTTADEKKRLYFCTANETYYYWDALSGAWNETDTGSIYSAFCQTADGFSLKGNVEIDGSLLTSGEIRGLTVGTKPNTFGDRVELNTAANRLELYYGHSCVAWWEPSLGESYLRAANSAALVLGSEGSFVEAKGDWDFSDADVTGVFARFG